MAAVVSFKHKGNLSKTENFLRGASQTNLMTALRKYGDEGVRLLSGATPTDTGETASSWYYEVIINRNSFSIAWFNSHVVGGTPVVVLLQYGHGTRNGGYVRGRDFINPVMQPLFDRMANAAWEEITRL